MKQCEEEPEIKTITTIEYIEREEDIKDVEISKPKKAYIKKVKTKKQKNLKDKNTFIKDSILYVDKNTPNAIEVSQYDTQLKSNNATADLKITVIGELLDVTGTISYKEKQTTVETTKTVHASGLFLYMGTSLSPTFEKIELGLDYQIRNKFLIGTSVDYNNFTKSVNFNVKLGIRIL